MAGSGPTTTRAVGRCCGLAVVLVALALTVAACGSETPGQTGSATPDAGTTAAPVDLSGSWHLVDGADGEGALGVPAGHEITLVVDGDEAGGVSACNRYTATVRAESGTVAFEGIGGTEMGCEPGVMATERRFVTALSSVDSAERSGESLELTGPGVTLTFEEDKPTADADLVGTTWRLESLVDGDTVASTVPGGLVVLSDDGTWRATTGCGDLRGGYRLSGGRVTVHDVRAQPVPDGACDEQATAQHAHVSGVLLGGFEATVQDDLLRLTGGDGRGLDYRAR